MSTEAPLEPNPPVQPAPLTTSGSLHSRFAAAERMVFWQRGLLIFVGLVLVSLLVTAALLPPSPRGIGTHQQLGLPPCSVIMIFGVRCPACGMTTSWAHFMRGQWLQSAEANAGGLLLALFALIGGPWMLASAAAGRWWLGMLDPAWVLGFGGLLFMVTMAQWLWRVLQ